MSDLGNKQIMSENIMKYLNRRGMNMKDLATQIGVPYTTVISWCKGDNYPRIDKIERMAQFFGISKADLVERDNQEKNIDELLRKAFADRPEMAMLFSVAKDCTREDIEKTIKIIEALK